MEPGGPVALRRRPGLAWVEVDGEVVVWDPTRPAAHLLSASGALLWPLFDGSATVEELAADVVEVFDLDPDDALLQVRSFGTSLLEAGLLEQLEGGGDQ